MQPVRAVGPDGGGDRIARAGGQRAGSGVDLLAHFARPFPLAVICELLGLPPEDRPKFSRYSSRLTTAHNLPGIIWGLLGLRPLMQYVREEIRRQSHRPVACAQPGF